MEAMIHLIFELFKIAILSSVYATIIVISSIILGIMYPKSCFKNKTSQKFLTWFGSGFIIYISLFFYLFSYWGNHGLGDGAIIPLGHDKIIEQTNSTHTSISPKDYSYGSMAIKTFIVKKNYLCGESTSNYVDKPEPYFIWNLKKDTLTFFDSEMAYNKFAIENELPNSNEFESFWKVYNDYWGGWRFWLLP